MKLTYEDIVIPITIKTIAPFVTEEFGCEHEGCENDAVIEFVMQDEDGDNYYTLRCEQHPVKSNNYEVRYL